MTTLRRRINSESSDQPSILVDKTNYYHNNSDTSGQSGGYNNDIVVKEAFNSKPIMSRDRTNEFSTAIRALHGRHSIKAASVKDPIRARRIQNTGEFMIIARNIGKNISSTYAKLEKLTLLAKRKTLFNDQPGEIKELTYIIKEDLNSLNTQIAQLQDVMRNQHSEKALTKNNHLKSHSSTIVVSLQSKLASMTSQLKHVLEVRNENLKEAKRRREQFSQVPVVTSLPHSSSSNGRMEGSVLLGHSNDNGQVSIDLTGIRQSQMQMAAHDDTEQYLTSRAETMQNIESTIVELGGIFQQLAHMVKEQEEMVDRIDANVGDTELNVESAHNEILKYFQSVTSNRWLMIKIFGVVICFFMFFMIFMA